jgi:hypothetical protein
MEVFVSLTCGNFLKSWLPAFLGEFEIMSLFGDPWAIWVKLPWEIAKSRNSFFRVCIQIFFIKKIISLGIEKILLGLQKEIEFLGQKWKILNFL